MTIGKKLLWGFGSVIVMTAMLGLIALVKIGTMSEGIEKIVKTSLPDVYFVGTLSGFAKEERMAMISHIASDSAGEMQNFDALIESNSKKLSEGVKTFDQNNKTPRDREYVARLTEANETILRAWEKIKPLSASLKTKQALNVWLSEAIPAGAVRAKVLQEMADSSKAGGDEDGDLATKAAASGRTWLIIVLFIAVFGGAAIAFLILRSTNSDLKKAVDELGQGAEEVTGAAAQISSGSQSLAQGTSEQAASLEETSSSSQEMAAMTKKNADSSREAANLMSIVDQRVLAANETLAEMVVSMGEITSSSDRISKIIKVIDEIAFQTNILALNAAVEAARAGEAGMGFAVVAEEVRNLAQRSAQAAKDTAALIEESIGRSSEGRTKLGKVEQAIRSITESSQKVKALVDDVNLSSTEQARGSEQIANAITQMEHVTQQAAASAEESAAAGEEMAAQARAMLAVVGRLRAMVEGSHVDAGSANSSRAAAQKSIRPAAYRHVHQTAPPRIFKNLSPSTEPVMTAVSAERDSFPMDDDFKEF
ncbi:MAG: methyl-accepting chemotaxis protein [Bryobacteraceae bacterium]